MRLLRGLSSMMTATRSVIVALNEASSAVGPAVLGGVLDGFLGVDKPPVCGFEFCLITLATVCCGKVNLMKYKTKRVRRAAKTMLRDLRSSVVRIFLIASLSRQSQFSAPPSTSNSTRKCRRTVVTVSICKG